MAHIHKHKRQTFVRESNPDVREGKDLDIALVIEFYLFFKKFLIYYIFFECYLLLYCMIIFFKTI